MHKTKLAIIGASYLQLPLVEKANNLGIETHVFAWEKGADAKDIAHVFYPVSILEKELILENCKELKIDGITSIGSDIAMPTVNYVATKLGLVGNSLESTKISTDKYDMRKALSEKAIPCPRFEFYDSAVFHNKEQLKFPLIVKPTDRSGSRGVTKVNTEKETNLAITKALENSINKRVIVEEFIKSEREFSVEFISFKGKHYPLAITDKVKTRVPYFVELEHHQPAKINETAKVKIFKTVADILNALSIENGASHTEVFLLDNGAISVVECAGRMGGDFIGSSMVQLSTGFDYMKAVIDVALNQFEYENYIDSPVNKYSGVYYVAPKPGKIISITDHSKKYNDIVYCKPLMNIGEYIDNTIDGSDKRAGVIVYSSSVTRPIKNLLEVLEIKTE